MKQTIDRESYAALDKVLATLG